ncbi:Cyclin-dependent kinase 2-interacting protein [Blattella germanica]|nr:Cyclin-dependent kinase 2-interacting protein [Blattella germanica]
MCRIDCETDKEKKCVYPENLQEHCEKLDGIVSNMDEIVTKLQTVAQQMHSVENLEKLQNVNKAPLFLTWPVSRYGEVMDELCSAYSNELKSRIIVKESIAHSSTKEELSYYVITWVHQPFIDSQVEFLLESLLQETGHR